MAKVYDFQWQVTVPDMLLNGDIFDRWQEVRLTDHVAEHVTENVTDDVTDHVAGCVYIMSWFVSQLNSDCRPYLDIRNKLSL